MDKPKAATTEKQEEIERDHLGQGINPAIELEKENIKEAEKRAKEREKEEKKQDASAK